MLQLRSFRPLRRHVVLAIVALAFLGTAHAQTYWFENYQRAVSLIDANRGAEALPLLEQVIQDHPLPQAGMRIPGYQFLDYLPYYQRARIEVQMGQYERASRSLDVSEAFGEAGSSKRSMADASRLRQQIDSALASSDRAPALASEKLPR
jgi:hypothetical protein